MVLCSVIDVVKKIADKCVEPIVGYVKTGVCYLCNYKANVEKLRDEVVNMNAEIASMKARIQAENRSGKTEVDAHADNWVKMMTSLIDKASKIIEEEERETERCLMGLRPNLWACYQASKSAKEVMDSADELKKVGEKIKTVANFDYSQCLGVVPNTEFEELESRKRAKEQIVAYLKDPSVKVVGMYGMGGTGKTTLAEKIGVQLYEDGTFRYVVKTDVFNNQNTDLTHIQKQIANQLQISLGDDGDDVKARAKQLRKQLEKMDKVLIILDDIWSRFELREVGIPLNRELKLLITSRGDKVMNEMGSRHNVPLNVLSPEDSWKLFDRIADGVAPDSDRYSTAREVVEQCGGIPVLLVTIAIALRDEEDLETWKEALYQLKTFEGDDFVKDGYKRLEVSYKFLRDYELKSLFLLCAQLDHRFIPIDDLLRYSMGLGLYNREKLCDVRSRLHSDLSHLKSYCWLQDGNMEGTVRMHDVVHKFAASIVNKDRRIPSTVAEAQLQEWPSMDKVVQFSISLPHRHLPPDHQLPVAFDSSKLESFLLLRVEYEAFLKVPDEFFIGMKNLKLVDIRRMSLSPVLCSSFNVLEKLRTLCLDYCKLDDIAVIGELSMLQVLSLKGSTVSQIERLGSNLKLLDLRDCERLEVIASGVLSNLILLEDLRIGGSFDKWEPLQGSNSGSDHETSTTKKLASLREFKNLGNLINLDIQIPDPKTFPKDLVFKKVERFNIRFGSKGGYLIALPEYSATSLKVKLHEGIQLYEGIKMLMEKAKNLHLDELLSVTSVCELVPKGFPELMCLTVKSPGIQFMVKKSYNNCAVFPKLERLYLDDMRKLERICDGHHLMLPVGSLQNLTTIHVNNCKVLKYLFSSHLALRGLLCLKEIDVQRCESMESIVSRESENRITGDDQLDDNEEEIIEFTQLRKLKLSRLGRLISFYSSSTSSPIISSSQERQEQDPISSNQRLPISLFNKKVVLSKLKELRLWRLNVDRILAIEVERINCCFQNLTILIVYSCHNLSYLFTSSMVRSLAQFKKLEVWECESIEEIVAIKGGMAGDEEEIIEFTQLQKLTLYGLGGLISFYSNGNSTPNPIMSSAQEIQEQDHISFFNKKVAFPNLERVIIEGIHKVKMIWENQQHLNLRYVTISWCRNLTSIFPASVAVALKQLQDLTIIECENLKEIVSKEEEEDGGPTFVFPKLTSLYLKELPELERFYGGGVDISDWPSLGELDVYRCDKLIDPSNLNLNIQKILTTPSLKTCNLRGTNVGVRYESLSGKLKVDGDIQNIGCSSVFPIALFEMFQKLEIFQELKEVRIGSFCFEQLFPCEPVVGDDHDINTQAIAKTLARTKHLYLSHLSEMKHIWSEQYADDQFDGIPLNLEILEVESCGSLMSLAPKSALFQDLTRLVVRGCNELIKLVASSTTAKSLVNLTKMRVSECDSLKEIVAIYGDHDGEEASNNTTEDIVFGKLETLVLESLRSLTSFTTNNCNFQFPSLEQVIVAECPNMEFFSRGALSTPKLSGVWIEEERKMLESDLNSTVRQLYKAMNSTEEYLEPE